MSTNASERTAGWRGAWNAWGRFWFTPADPTVLALIRIGCGLIAFYTLVAYTRDLDEMIGEHAWVDLATRQLMYRESPVQGGVLSWQSYPIAPLPRNQEEKHYWDTYFKTWNKLPPAPYPRDLREADLIDEYHARWGVDPRVVYSMGKAIWSLWFHVTDPDEILRIHLAFVAISFLFALGFCTRLTGAVTWFAVLCYTHRAPATVFGVDTMMVVVLLYLMIGPSGAVLSVDRWFAQWWARARPRVIVKWHRLWGKVVPAAPPGELPEPAPSVAANLAIRLLQIHVCIIYLSAGLAKLQGQAWWTGTAIWGTLANFEFAPMQYDWYVRFLQLLTANRVVFEILVTGAGLFTLAFEIGYAFLVWRPATRWVMLWGAIILHGFIGLFMGLKTFSLMMLTMNLAFVPPETAKRILRRCLGEWNRAREPPVRKAA